MDLLEIVVPSVRPTEEIAGPLTALRGAIEVAGLLPRQVTVVDDHPRRDAERRQVVQRMGFRYERTSGNVGPGGSRNLGAGGASEWLLFIDDDVVLDRDCLGYLCGRLSGDLGGDVVAIMGALRVPSDAPPWFGWADEAGLTNPASAAGPEGTVPLGHLCSAIVAVRRQPFEAVGGFPQSRTWEDILLGHRLRDRYPGARLVRDHSLSGVHLNVPRTWEDWLARQRSAGRRLAVVATEVSAWEHDRLVAGLNLGGGPRGRTKRLASRLPPRLWHRVRGRHLRRLAASAAFARGYFDELGLVDGCTSQSRGGSA